MTTPENIPDAIDENARGPLRVRVGNEEVQQHTIPDQIAADNHKAGKAAASRSHFGLRFSKIIPPGAG